MKVSRTALLAANSKRLRFFTPGMTKDDLSATIDKKVGDSVTILPEDTEAKSITVRFDINALMAMADEEPDTKTLAKALSAVGIASANALTTGGTLNLVVNGAAVAGKAADVASELFSTQNGGESPSFYVPVANTKSACKYSISTTIHAITLTTDDDDKEVANLTTYARWDNVKTDNKTTKNVGTKRAIRAVHDHGLSELPGVDGLSTAAVWTLVDLATDGDWWHDTISAVNIQAIEFVITEKCPASEDIGEDGEKPKFEDPKDDGHGQNDKEEDKKPDGGKGEDAPGSDTPDDKDEKPGSEEDKKKTVEKAYFMAEANTAEINELRERLGTMEAALEDMLTYIKKS